MRPLTSAVVRNARPKLLDVSRSGYYAWAARQCLGEFRNIVVGGPLRGDELETTHLCCCAAKYDTFLGT